VEILSRTVEPQRRRRRVLFYEGHCYEIEICVRFQKNADIATYLPSLSQNVS
jgi:hypothetical protein